MTENQNPTRIEVNQSLSSPEEVSVRRRKVAKVVAGTVLGLGAAVHGIAEDSSNPVGHLVGDVINTGIKVVDAVPGVDVADVNLPSPSQVEDMKQGKTDVEDLYIPENLQQDYTQWEGGALEHGVRPAEQSGQNLE